MLATAGLVFLLFTTWGRWDYLAISLVYGLAAIWLFTASSVYHAFKQRENDTGIRRKLDHIAIFVMIAGTYTPIAYIYLNGAWFWSIFCVQWGCVLLGLGQKLFFFRAPRLLSPILYLLQGWVAVIPIYQFWQAMSPTSFFLMFTGGLAYSIGAVFYALKKPNPLPGVFGFHELFHILILVGWALHFAMIYLAVN